MAFCPNVSNINTLKDFNRLVQSFGGKPLQLIEFKDVSKRELRTGVDLEAMNVAYYLWDYYKGVIPEISDIIKKFQTPAQVVKTDNKLQKEKYEQQGLDFIQVLNETDKSVSDIVSEPVNNSIFEYDSKVIKTPFDLTEGQRKALQKLIDFSNSKDSFITLQGQAGTGKTSIIGLLKSYLGNSANVIFMAPTHAATAELAFATAKLGSSSLPFTVQSSFSEDILTKDIKITSKLNNKINEFTTNIIVIDEVSLLGDDYYEMIKKIAEEKPYIKFIFIGDIAQLPEVKEASLNKKKFVSKAFINHEQVKLTEVKRTNDYAILEILNNIRNSVSLKLPKVVSNTINYFNKRGDFANKLLQDIINNPEGTTLISYTNEVVQSYNKKIREAFGNTGNLKVGEVIVGYLGYQSKQLSSGDLANSVKYTVTNINKQGSTFTIQAESNKLKNLNSLGMKVPYVTNFTYIPLSKTDSLQFDSITEEDYSSNNKFLSDDFRELFELKKKALQIQGRAWVNFYNKVEVIRSKFRSIELGDYYLYNPMNNRLEKVNSSNAKILEEFPELEIKKGVDYGYAITIHKSQGSTIENVYFDPSGISTGKDTNLYDNDTTVGSEMKSLLYVALSRASKNLNILTDNISIPVEELGYFPTQDNPKVILDKNVKGRTEQELIEYLRQKYPEIKLDITNNPIWEQGNNVFNQEEFNNQVQYRLKAVDILSSDKAKQVFEKGEKNNWDLNKILTELQVPKEQKQIILDKNWQILNQARIGNLKSFDIREEIITSLLADNSFVVEINTVKSAPNSQVTDEGGNGFTIGNKTYIAEQGYTSPEYFIYENGNRVEITEKEFNDAKDNSIIKEPTQYYSNLTVPGGTNYTENEIATPAITPSIKGHAEFASDQGIGWFRSDDKLNPPTEKIAKELYDIYEEDFGEEYEIVRNTLSEELTRQEYIIQKILKLPENTSILPKDFISKTRRILEVQSDLFQKGRDKNNLITPASEGILLPKNKFTKVTKQEYYEAANKGKETSGVGTNEFGYSVTYEYNNKLYTEIDNGEYGYLDKSKDDKSNENKFLQLLNKDNNWVTFFIKSIIQDSVKKGYEKVLFPKGDTASKIEGHSTLEEFKKQKEDRRNNLIKDLDKGYIERNNQKIELDSDMRSAAELEIQRLNEELERVETEGFAALRPIYKFYEETVGNILRKQYKDQIQEVIDEYGNSWLELPINHVRDLQNIMLQKNEANQIIGQANIKAMTVLVDAVNKKADTIPHEYAHHYIAWFRDTSIVQEGIKRFGSEEALVQAIGEQVIKQKGEAYNWWKKFTNWILNLLSDRQLLQVLTDSFLNRQNLNDFIYNNSQTEKQYQKVNDNLQKSDNNSTSNKVYNYLLDQYGIKKGNIINKDLYVPLSQEVAALNKKLGYKLFTLEQSPDGNWRLYKTNVDKHPIYETLFNGKTVAKMSEVLTNISRLDEVKFPLAKVAKKLLPYSKINNVNIEILPVERLDRRHFKSTTSEIADGVYKSVENKILVFNGVVNAEKDIIRVLLHEMLHALSYHEFRNNNKYNTDFKKLYDRYKEVNPDDYSSKTIDEFFVAIFTDVNFIKKAKKIEPLNIDKYPNLWEELVNFILDVLGLTKNESLYEQAYSIATNYLTDGLNNVLSFEQIQVSVDLTEIEKCL